MSERPLPQSLQPALIERVADFVERLPPRGLTIEEPSAPLFRRLSPPAVGAGVVDPTDPAFDPERGCFYDPPALPLDAFDLSDGSYYGPGDRGAAGGLAAAVVAVCERDGVEVSAAVAAGREAAAGGLAGDQRFLELALGVERDTAEALATGSGALREVCPARAVTGAYVASALRRAADGDWGHNVWRDVLPDVAPGNRVGPRVDPSAYVDPQAHLSRDAVVGPDAYVGGGAVVLAGTRVGAGTRVDDGAVLGPDTVVGDGVWVGADAHVRHARVGDGSVVEDTGIVLGADLPAGSVVVAR